MILLIYTKKDTIKVLESEQAEKQESELVKNGWVLARTLDARKYIEYLHNSCQNVDREIKSLAKGK